MKGDLVGIHNLKNKRIKNYETAFSDSAKCHIFADFTWPVVLI